MQPVLPRDLYAASKRRGKIGILGGSFNPAHAGHVAISLTALKRLGLQEVWWLVTPNSPLKSADSYAPLAQRVAYAQQVAKHPKLKVIAWEQALGECRTVPVLRILNQRCARLKLAWIMGSDSLYSLPQWHLWPLLFKENFVAVCPRPGYCSSIHAAKAAHRFRRARLPGSQAKALFAHEKPAWTVLPMPLEAVSSTQLRRASAHQKGTPSVWPLAQ